MCWNVSAGVWPVSLFSGWLLTWWMEAGSDRQQQGSMVSMVPATKSWLLYLFPSSPSSSCLFSSGDRHSRRMQASLHPVGQRVHVRKMPPCAILQVFRCVLQQSCGYRHSVARCIQISQTNLRTGPLPCALNPLGTLPDPYHVCTSYPIKPSP